MNGFFRIGIALTLGAVLLVAAFNYRGQVVANNQEGAVAATIVQTEKKYVPTKDSDGDGMRDWEEELRGTDPFTPNEHKELEELIAVQSESSEGDEDEEVDPFVPETVTDEFAIEFFEEYLRNNAGDREFSEDEQLRFLDSSVDLMVEKSKDVFFTLSQLNSDQDNSLASVREYGNVVGTIILQNSVPEGQEHELIILERAMQSDDESVLEDLDPIIIAYDHTINDLLAVTVPSSLLKQHLDLLNAVLGMYNNLQSFRNTFTDPLPSLVRFKRYEDDLLGLANAIDNLRTAFESEGIIYTKGEAGSFFFSLRP